MMNGREAGVAGDEWRIAVPARISLLGPSGSGKSEILLRLVEDDTVWERPAKFVIYSAPTLEDRSDYLRRMEASASKRGKKLWCVEGLPPPSQMVRFSGGRPSLLLADDLAMMEDLSGLNSLASMHGRHLNISVVFALQSPFLKSKRGVDFPAFARNLTAYFILNQRADYRLYSALNTMLFPERKNWLVSCLEEAEKNGCHYLYVDLHPRAKLGRRLMVRTCVFSDQRVSGSPLFFDMQAAGGPQSSPRKP